ncbi:CinA family protein [Hespellia stercorisuis]|uniref:Nicotinamide-nucleotide amidase n=1 Tax=Hespellia stercorisuis DSM 15480 TaxID=1121950 RepID=A0A1M6HSS2_9FIRM|nr:nicotinamide-nucleotide amidohydrolase family protein [Hespellia stercorisuis]SHJ25223.1 nicotinamide-nucleotide amidase [Hespellia stercorisuis DSM 15480]
MSGLEKKGYLLEERIVEELAKRGWAITTAESCTGGLLSGTIVDVPGASDVLNEAHVTYSNEAKERVLGVSHEVLKTYGAVSSQTAQQMAEGAAHAAHADVALSTTGIAGPGGGTVDKPVGMVYIGCYVNGRVTDVECHFTGNRSEIRHSAVNRALEILWEEMNR